MIRPGRIRVAAARVLARESKVSRLMADRSAMRRDLALHQILSIDQSANGISFRYRELGSRPRARGRVTREGWQGETPAVPFRGLFYLMTPRSRADEVGDCVWSHGTWLIR
jgi:hypothetical protein